MNKSRDTDFLDEFPRTPENAWLFEFKSELKGEEAEYEDKCVFENPELKDNLTNGEK